MNQSPKQQRTQPFNRMGPGILPPRLPPTLPASGVAVYQNVVRRMTTSGLLLASILSLSAVLFTGCGDVEKEGQAVQSEPTPSAAMAESEEVSDKDGDGFSISDGDCDDTDGQTYPGAARNDSESKCMKDSDGDLYGDKTPPEGIEPGTDCKDGLGSYDAGIYPGAVEVCDGIDNDCDREIDIDAVDVSEFYADSDGDQFGNGEQSAYFCTRPLGFAPEAGDCNDQNPAISPIAIEFCDHVDNDCDGSTDEESIDGLDWYEDRDGDGYGEENAHSKACVRPAGFVADSTDCNDAVAAIHPDADEFCNEADQDCDGGNYDADSLDALLFFLDTDGDGFGIEEQRIRACSRPVGYSDQAEMDCNDADASIHPMQEEICNGTDDNCDGLTDGPDSVDIILQHPDMDGDLDGDPMFPVESCTPLQGYVENAMDCDDSDPLQNSGDVDGDGYSTCSGDCDDSDSDAFPGAAENDSADL
jgi:hypothetical protein